MSAGALASLAGCTDAISSVAGGGGASTQWLPEPGTIGDSDHYSFSYIDTATIASNEDELSDDTVDSIASLEQYWSSIDLDWDETASFLIVGDLVGVTEADYDTEDVVDDLEDDDFEEDSEYEGYRLFEKDASGVAIGNGYIVSTFLSEDPIDDLEDLIDVSNGEEDRYVDEEEDMQALTDELGGGTFVSGRTADEPDEENVERGQFDDMVAKGRSLSINGETSDLKHVVVYEREADVDTGDLEEWVEANENSDQQFDDVDDIEYNQNGRLGIVTGTIDTDDIL